MILMIFCVVCYVRSTLKRGQCRKNTGNRDSNTDSNADSYVILHRRMLYHVLNVSFIIFVTFYKKTSLSNFIHHQVIEKKQTKT